MVGRSTKERGMEGEGRKNDDVANGVLIMSFQKAGVSVNLVDEMIRPTSGQRSATLCSSQTACLHHHVSEMTVSI